MNALFIFQEHLEGQKHKKKAAMAAAANNSAASAGSKGSSAGGGGAGGGGGGASIGPVNTATPKVGNALRCELCDVTCTGSDAYAAHIRGAKHQKVIKLHTR